MHTRIAPPLMIVITPTRWSWGRPFIGMMPAPIRAMTAFNDYASDGTTRRRWVTIPGALSTDERGRVRAWIPLIRLSVTLGTIVLYRLIGTVVEIAAAAERSHLKHAILRRLGTEHVSASTSGDHTRKMGRDS